MSVESSKGQRSWFFTLFNYLTDYQVGKGWCRYFLLGGKFILQLSEQVTDTQLLSHLKGRIEECRTFGALAEVFFESYRVIRKKADERGFVILR